MSTAHNGRRDYEVILHFKILGIAAAVGTLQLV